MFHRYKHISRPAKLMLESVMPQRFTPGSDSTCEGVVFLWRGVCLAYCFVGVVFVCVVSSIIVFGSFNSRNWA